MNRDFLNCLKSNFLDVKRWGGEQPLTHRALIERDEADLLYCCRHPGGAGDAADGFVDRAHFQATM